MTSAFITEPTGFPTIVLTTHRSTATPRTRRNLARECGADGACVCSPGVPPGDHAIMASSGGAVMVALVADGQACARFLAPDFIKTMLVEVGQGITVGVGTPL